MNIKNMNKFSKKVKIVATIGPATEDKKTLEKLLKAGMNVMRLNFSHGDFVEHGNRIKNLRAVSKKLGKPVGIIQDLAGPKIRTGDFYKERIILKKGSEFVLTTKKIVGDETRAYVNYKNLHKDVKPGSLILLDDGKKKLKVLRVVDGEIFCRVVVGGELKGRRGVNIPGANLKISAITAKDKKDLLFGIENMLDYVALSFVRGADDIKKLRSLLDKSGGKDIDIIAKIETLEAITRIDEIIKIADGIMVARGDLAIEVPAQEVPLLQKMIIKKCHIAGKPVIVATQMLESMIHSPVPTRAEVSDVANAILDGTDAVMLSEETALGKYPLEAVETMSSVAREVQYESRCGRVDNRIKMRTTVDAVTSSVVTLANEVDAKAIIALTESGFTARMISRFKPRQPIIAMSPKKKVQFKLSLLFACYPVEIKSLTSISETSKEVRDFVLKQKIAKKNDKVVISAGIPFGEPGATNMAFVLRI